jgi:hypothetical protein
MYKVSPKPKPIIPLMLARIIAYTGKTVKASNLPMTAKQTTKTMPVHVHRMMFAETGFVFNNASLYSIADMVQQIAAPKAASSPIIVSPFQLLTLLITRLKGKDFAQRLLKYLTFA